MKHQKSQPHLSSPEMNASILADLSLEIAKLQRQQWRLGATIQEICKSSPISEQEIYERVFQREKWQLLHILKADLENLQKLNAPQTVIQQKERYIQAVQSAIETNAEKGGPDSSRSDQELLDLCGDLARGFAGSFAYIDDEEKLMELLTT